MDIRPKAASEILGCSQVWLHKLRKAGTGPSYEKRGGMYYYSFASVIRWVLDWKVQPLAERIEAVEAELAAPLDDGPSRAELSERLAVVENALAKIRRDQKRKRKPLVPALPS
jgi:hypothetical protein